MIQIENKHSLNSVNAGTYVPQTDPAYEVSLGASSQVVNSSRTMPLPGCSSVGLADRGGDRRRFSTS